MNGFLNIDEVPEKRQEHLKVPRCGKCGLRKKCNNPFMEPQGEGAKGILIVTDYLTSKNDRENSPLTGVEEKFVSKIFKKAGIDLWKDCIVTSSTICSPRADEPTSFQIESCRPNIWRIIKKYKPNVIIPMGNNGARCLFSQRVKQDANAALWRGHVIPDIYNTGAWICPVSDPYFILNDNKYGEVAETLFIQDIQQMTNYLKKDVKQILPDLDNVIIDTKEASRCMDHILRLLKKQELLIAVDYETNMLKPHSEEANLVSVGMCYNKDNAFAYLLDSDEMIDKTVDILSHSNAKLIAGNMLMEIGWTVEWLAVENSNWYWDTVLAAHVLDNRRKNSNVKFQGFVNFGVETYDEHVAPYLKSDKKGGHEKNTIHSINTKELLKYNAIDALIEYHLMLSQTNKINVMSTK